MPLLLEARNVVKSYGGLRPLRLAELAIAPGEIVGLEGPDETAASVLVDLLTGTTLPDAGEVAVAGSPTSALADHDAWLGFLEQFGLVNARVVLLDQLTVLQNLAVPLTLDLDPLPPDVRERATALGSAVGLAADSLDAPLATATPLARLRVRLGRAIAHAPRLLLIEHPTLGLARDDGGACADALRAAVNAAAPGAAALLITRDRALARAVATRVIAWDAASGRAVPREGWRKWLGH
jgi:predicted ABC-type transport system involved in lysophospholipase L1 biosynthesis ATPase subunit